LIPHGGADWTWQQYCETIVEIEVEPGRWVDLNGPDAVEAVPLDTPVYVLTAWNPYGQDQDEELNEAAQRDLIGRLSDRNLGLTPAMGRSVDRSHREQSVAVTGLDRASACALGRHYRQEAIFEIDADTITVVACETGPTTTVDRINRRPQRSAPATESLVVTSGHADSLDVARGSSQDADPEHTPSRDGACGATFDHDPTDVPSRVQLYFASSLDAVFGQASDVTLPWRSAGGLKHRHPWDQALVRAAVHWDAGEFVEIDPRVLTASQPAAIRAGVDYYLNRRTYEDTGWTYADQHNPGNRIPIIYSRTDDHHRTVDIILSGHHRSMAALIAGRPLFARRITGGYGGLR